VEVFPRLCLPLAQGSHAEVGGGPRKSESEVTKRHLRTSFMHGATAGSIALSIFIQHIPQLSVVQEVVQHGALLLILSNIVAIPWVLSVARGANRILLLSLILFSLYGFWRPVPWNGPHIGRSVSIDAPLAITEGDQEAFLIERGAPSPHRAFAHSWYEPGSDLTLYSSERPSEIITDVGVSGRSVLIALFGDGTDRAMAIALFSLPLVVDRDTRAESRLVTRRISTFLRHREGRKLAIMRTPMTLFSPLYPMFKAQGDLSDMSGDLIRRMLPIDHHYILGRGFKAVSQRQVGTRVAWASLTVP
jgi:hypothetical protein